MDVLLKSIFLSILPVSELRGGITYAVVNNINPLLAFFACTLANILVLFPLFFFLDYIHYHLMGIKSYNKISSFIIKRVEGKKDHIEKKMENLGFIALALFVAVPFPATGAYTGVLIAWLLNLDRKKSIIAIASGVIIAGIVVTLLTSTSYNLITGLISYIS